MIPHRQVTTTNELRPVFHFDISSIIGVLGKDGGWISQHTHTHTRTHTQLGGGIHQTARTREREPWGLVVFFFRLVWLAWGFTSGATFLRREEPFFVWLGPAFPPSMPRCLVPLSPSNYNFFFRPGSLGPDAIPFVRPVLSRPCGFHWDESVTLSQKQISMGTCDSFF